MKRLFLPILLLLIGIGSGVGAALYLKPVPTDDIMLATGPCGDVPDDHEAPDDIHEADDDAESVAGAREYARMNNQFVIPVVDEGQVAAMVVMSLSIEVTPGNKEPVFAAEPKLRDAFLQDMFDHANIGGFSGNFTSGTNMRLLRNALLRSARQIAGDRITDVLIIDIVRQDV